VIGLLTSGCGGGPAGGDNDLQTRRQLSLVATIYGDYLALHGNVPPASEADLVATFTDYLPRIKALKLPESSELLVSRRDGEPFLLAYRAESIADYAPWIAIERVGVEGKRLGVQGRGVLEEVTPDQLPEPMRAALSP
jgi:hypothetical protein